MLPRSVAVLARPRYSACGVGAVAMPKVTCDSCCVVERLRLLCVCYTLFQYPHHVKQLLLVSPPCGPTEYVPPTMCESPITRISLYWWSVGFMPQALMRWMGPLSQWFLKFAMRRWYDGKIENAAVAELLAAYTVRD